MFKVLLLCVCMVATIVARPQFQPQPQFQPPSQQLTNPQFDLSVRNWANAVILKFLYENYGLGFAGYQQEQAPPPRAYAYSYAQSDGHNKEESGSFINEGTDNESLAVQGAYSYIGDDGVQYNVTYTADENGFQPQGDHIPPSAGVKPKLGIPSAALASLAGGGLGK